MRDAGRRMQDAGCLMPDGELVSVLSTYVLSSLALASVSDRGATCKAGKLGKCPMAHLKKSDEFLSEIGSTFAARRVLSNREHMLPGSCFACRGSFATSQCAKVGRVLQHSWGPLEARIATQNPGEFCVLGLRKIRRLTIGVVQSIRATRGRPSGGFGQQESGE